MKLIIIYLFIDTVLQIGKNSMINFLVKNIIKKAAIKLATDKKLRNKLKTGVEKAKDLNDKGELIKTFGKGMGRLKKKLYK